MVTFDYLNLIEDRYPSLTNNTGGMDLILCRNVTIYFNAEVTQQVVNNFYNCLVNGGWYVPGASEPNLVTYKAFEHRSFPGAVIYKKAAPRLSDPVRTVPTFTMRPLPEYGPLAAAVQPPPAPVLINNGEPKQPQMDPFLEAQKLFESGRMEEALVKLYEKLDRNPNHVPAYCVLGKIYANKGNLEEAQHWCERAIGKDKLKPMPYFTLSMVYQGHGLQEQAIDALKKTLYLDPTFILAHYVLGNLYLQHGDKDLAHRSFQNAQRLLTGKPKEEPVPEGDGLIVGRLQELIEMALGNGS
jgi:chemotaxis protein methyltransferase CheR